MKKLLPFFLFITLLMGCTTKKETEQIKIEGIQEINYKELTQNLNSDVKFIVYIGRPDCGDCQAFYPLLENYIQDNKGTGIYYLNIKNFRDSAKAEDASQKEKDFYENLYKELHFDWTPTIHVISNGEFVKTYQYLDENYIKIEDREEQLKRKQEFLDDFTIFMNNYFKGDVR